MALPVLGAAAMIAGGTAAPALGVEALLRWAPFQWLGAISYSLYLWHWPVLIIAAYCGEQDQPPLLPERLPGS